MPKQISDTSGQDATTRPTFTTEDCLNRDQGVQRLESASDFHKFIESMSALAFIRGYAKAALSEKHDKRTIQLLATIHKKATEGLIASGVEIDTKVT